MTSFRQLLRSPVAWPLAGLLLLIVVNLVRDPAFLRLSFFDGHLFGVPVDIFNQGSRIMILALGMTLVIATGGIDLSVGSVVAVAGAVAAMLITQGVESLPLILAAAAGAGLLAGLANGALVAYAGVQPIVATLIFMVAGRGIAQLVTGGQVLIVKHPAFEFLGNGFLLGLPFAALLAIALYLATHFALRRTAGRMFVEAVGDNPVASRFAGIATARVRLLVYAFCGLCAGIAGILAASNIRAADPYRAGENMELDAIFAVVVGGTALSGGRFLQLGSFVGALLLQTLTITMYNVGVSPAVATVPKACLILLVCVLQSDRTRRWLGGLFKRNSAA
jgi:ribose/xylose/arabinose/galactoside ABC-type transport system permease subunit